MKEKNANRKVSEMTKELVNSEKSKTEKKEKFDAKILAQISKIDKSVLTEKSISNKSIYKTDALKKYGKTEKRARAILRRKIYELSVSLCKNYELKTKLVPTLKKELKTIYSEILKNTDVFMNERKDKNKEQILKIAHSISFDKKLQ